MPHRITAKPASMSAAANSGVAKRMLRPSNASRSLESRAKSTPARGLADLTAPICDGPENVHAQSRNETEGGVVARKAFGITRNGTHNGEQADRGAGNNHVKRHQAHACDRRAHDQVAGNGEQPCPGRKRHYSQRQASHKTPWRGTDRRPKHRQQCGRPGHDAISTTLPKHSVTIRSIRPSQIPVVCRNDQCFAARAVQKCRTNLFRGRAVEIRRRLVREDQRCIGQHRARDGETAKLPA